jgi:hypothetical protein
MSEKQTRYGSGIPIELPKGKPPEPDKDKPKQQRLG